MRGRRVAGSGRQPPSCHPTRQQPHLAAVVLACPLLLALWALGGGLTDVVAVVQALPLVPTTTVSTPAFLAATTPTTTTAAASRRPRRHRQVATVLSSTRGGASKTAVGDGDDENEVDKGDDVVVDLDVECEEKEEEVDVILAHLADVNEDENHKVQPMEEVDASLASSAVKKSVQQKAKAAAERISAAKEVVNAKLATTTTAKTTYQKTTTATSLLKMLHVPYIIRILFNPMTVFRMSTAYWSSLFDVNYLTKLKDASQELRSEVEEKAKKGGATSGGSSGGPKGRRKMKRGQAKTLSNLPPLASSCEG